MVFVHKSLYRGVHFCPIVAEPKPTVRRIDAQKRIHLPPEALKALGADVGDYVSLTVCDDRVEVRKVRLP